MRGVRKTCGESAAASLREVRGRHTPGAGVLDAGADARKIEVRRLLSFPGDCRFARPQRHLCGLQVARDSVIPSGPCAQASPRSSTISISGFRSAALDGRMNFICRKAAAEKRRGFLAVQPEAARKECAGHARIVYLRIVCLNGTFARIRVRASRAPFGAPSPCPALATDRLSVAPQVFVSFLDGVRVAGACTTTRRGGFGRLERRIRTRRAASAPSREGEADSLRQGRPAEKWRELLATYLGNWWRKDKVQCTTPLSRLNNCEFG